MNEEKCQCGMPLNEETACKCNPKICYYCCECPSDCTCGCQQKVEEELHEAM